MDFNRRKQVVDVLNSLEIIESNGGEVAYALFELNEENLSALNEVGITDDIIKGYGDEETSCILAIGFGEGYADIHVNDKLVVFEEAVEINLGNDFETIIYKHEGSLFAVLNSNSRYTELEKLSEEQVNALHKLTSIGSS